MSRIPHIFFLSLFASINCTFCKDIDTESISREATSSVMLIHSEQKAGNEAIGTGFVLSQDGLIATNFHVIEGAEKLSVKSDTGGTYPVVMILATDKKRDIAILKVEARNLPLLELSDSDKVKPGMSIAVIGNPRGLESTITEGIVSAIRAIDDYGSVIQISAAISPGSSGSPVFDKEGHVIGMATFKMIKGEALNFAVPSNAIKEVLSEAKRAASVPADKRDSDTIYTPNRVVKGSKAQDEAAAKDRRFVELKKDEEKRDYFPMLSLAKELAKTYPESALSQRALSDAYYYADLLDDALSAAKKAIDLDPDNARGWNNLAIIYKVFEKYDQAAAIYAHAIKLAPDDVKLLIEYSDTVNAVNPSAARSALNHAKRQIIARSGIDAEIAGYNLESQLVYAYISIDRPTDAYDTAKEFAATFSTKPEVWLALAAAAKESKRYSEVLPAVQKAYQIDNSTADIANQIYGESELAQGNITTARDAYQKAYSINPANIRTLRGLVFSIMGKTYLSRDDYRDIQKYVNEIKGLDEEYGKKLEDRLIQELRDRSK